MAIADRTRIGIAMPHMFMDGKVDMEALRRYVRLAEDLGYRSLWCQERLTGKPTAIPGHISVDVSELEIGQTITVADLALPPGVTTDVDPEETVVIAQVTSAAVIEELEAAEAEAEEAAAGAAAGAEGEGGEAEGEGAGEGGSEGQGE